MYERYLMPMALAFSSDMMIEADAPAVHKYQGAMHVACLSVLRFLSQLSKVHT